MVCYQLDESGVKSSPLIIVGRTFGPVAQKSEFQVSQCVFRVDLVVVAAARSQLQAV